jgi:hypothetical protein
MKLFKKILFLFVGAFVAVTAINFYNYAQRSGWFGKNKINFETSYLGINIGDSKSDVYFALGAPGYAPDFKKFPDLEDYVLGYYKKSGGDINYSIAVNIQKNKVIGLSASAKRNRYDSNMDLKWIKLNTTNFKDVFARLGEQSAMFNFNEGVSRIFHFSKNNIFVGVEDANINFIGVGNLYFRGELFIFTQEKNPFFWLDYFKN